MYVGIYLFSQKATSTFMPVGNHLAIDLKDDDFTIIDL